MDTSNYIDLTLLPVYKCNFDSSREVNNSTYYYVNATLSLALLLPCFYLFFISISVSV